MGSFILYNSLNWLQNQDLTENFPTTCEDLAGFWDMVTIQINNVHAEFEQLDKLRKAGWPEQVSLMSTH